MDNQRYQEIATTEYESAEWWDRVERAIKWEIALIETLGRSPGINLNHLGTDIESLTDKALSEVMVKWTAYPSTVKRHSEYEAEPVLASSHAIKHGLRHYRKLREEQEKHLACLSIEHEEEKWRKRGADDEGGWLVQKLVEAERQGLVDFDTPLTESKVEFVEKLVKAAIRRLKLPFHEMAYIHHLVTKDAYQAARAAGIGYPKEAAEVWERVRPELLKAAQATSRRWYHVPASDKGTLTEQFRGRACAVTLPARRWWIPLATGKVRKRHLTREHQGEHFVAGRR